VDRGTILFHKKFQFTDGETGEKLLIILNEPDYKKEEPYLIVRTTTQTKNKPDIYGCHKNSSLFFIPTNKDFFKKDTWIQLHEVFPIDYKSFLQNRLEYNQVKIVGNLESLTLTHLLKCVELVEDISEQHKRMILRK